MLPILIAATIITNSSSATSDTGGNHAGPGDTVITGSAGVSNEVYNYSDEEGGYTTTHTHTQANGEVHDESTTTPITPGVPTVTNMSVVAGTASSTPQKPPVQTLPKHLPFMKTSVSSSSTLSQHESSTTSSFIINIFSWFKHLLGWYN